MSRSRALLAVGIIGGASIALGTIIAATSRKPHELPSADWQVFAGSYTTADVEAAARMIASEKPRGSLQLQVELVFTQLRARRPGESLFDRITAGSGWGKQGFRQAPGGDRPVATEEPANDAQRRIARDILDGVHQSRFVGARRFFEPEQQDKAVIIGNRAREKRARGEPLTAQEQRLIKYHKTAEQNRRDWLTGGSKYIDELEGIEFFS